MRLAAQNEASLPSGNGKSKAPDTGHAEKLDVQQQATNKEIPTRSDDNQTYSPALPEPRGSDDLIRQPREADSDPDPIRDLRPIPVTMQSVKLYTSTTEEATTGASQHSIKSMYLIDWVYKHVRTYVRLSILIIIATNLVHPGYGARAARIRAFHTLALSHVISTGL